MSVAVRVFGVRLHCRSLVCMSAVAAAAMTLGACSADSSRFDAGFGLSQDSYSDSITTASLRPSEPVYGSGGSVASTGQNRAYSPPSEPPPYTTFSRAPSAPPQRVERVALAPVARPVSQPAPQPEPRAEPAVYRPAPPEPAPQKTVTVQSGDTLSSIARRNGVSVDAIMAENGMTNTRLSIGQVLQIPAGGSSAQIAKARTHTVQDGESIYLIADRYSVGYKELAQYNGLRRPDLIQPGETLKIPPAAASSQTQVAANAPKAESRSNGVRVVRTRTIPAENAKPAARPVRVASADPRVPMPISSPSRGDEPTAPTRRAAEPAKPVRTVRLTEPVPMSGTEFRWPVRGRVISKFGSQPNGKHNDGINMAVPSGTAVKAAENGVVAYAGNELEGYGNLILIRHSDGWVSAYAHNSELLVKRGDTVKRGQVVAKAGQTGSVDQPQVHFELRKGSKPVDPIRHMAEM